MRVLAAIAALISVIAIGLGAALLRVRALNEADARFVFSPAFIQVVNSRDKADCISCGYGRVFSFRYPSAEGNVGQHRDIAERAIAITSLARDRSADAISGTARNLNASAHGGRFTAIDQSEDVPTVARGYAFQSNPGTLFRLEFCELAFRRIGLPLRLVRQFRQIAYGVLNVAGVAGDPVGNEGEDKHTNSDYGIDKVNNSYFSPQRLGGGALLVFGGALAIIGWLWLLAAARRNMTLGDCGWRGGVAIGLVLIGLALIWQSVPLAFAL